MLLSSIQTIFVMAVRIGAKSDPQFGQCLELPITPLYPHCISFNYIPMIIMIFDYIRSSSTLGGMSKVARSQLPPSFEHFSAGRPHTSDVEPSRMGFCATVFIRWMVAKSCTDRWFIPLFIGVRPSKVVQDFFHPHYVLFRKYAFKRK